MRAAALRTLFAVVDRDSFLPYAEYALNRNDPEVLQVAMRFVWFRPDSTNRGFHDRFGARLLKLLSHRDSNIRLLAQEALGSGRNS